LKITITAGEILDRGNWDKFCELRGINPYAINEGLPKDAVYELTIEEAVKCQLIDDDIADHICTGEPPF